MPKRTSSRKLHARPRDVYAVLAHVGYGARGVVYLIIGCFALAAAAGARARPAGSGDIFLVLITRPIGAVLVAMLAAGLLCFAAWRGLQAIVDVDHHGRSTRGLLRRAVHGANALFYFGFAAWAAAVAIGLSRNAGGEREVHSWTAWVMAMPLGRWLVGATGLVIVVVGFAIGAHAFESRSDRHLDLPQRRRRLADALFRFGEAARGLVFLLIGIFVVTAAVDYRATAAKGLHGALQTLQQQPYGWLALGVTALGFIAFGGFQLVEAVFRRVDTIRRHSSSSMTRTSAAS
ncbi:MAG: DUF1206 domain-containing protein [Bradyrhizobiaceae bacterium]|nr:DUF1206 domain-containing protein [Bradyrhizobiaceae bacterium]